MGFRKNRVLILVLLLTIVMSAFSARLFWWTIGGGGDVTGENEGTTFSQNTIGEVTSTDYEGTYGFWHLSMDPTLCISIDDSIWTIPESLNVNETVSMTTGDQISILNCGNCYVNLGLVFVETDPVTWAIGHEPGDNRFVCRAQFNDSDTAPVTYDFGLDWVKNTMTWALDDVFGPEGSAFPPGETRNLWMQLVSPTLSETYGSNAITISLNAQINLP